MEKPLLYHTILEAKKSKYISDYIISTDDIEIKKVAESFSANVPFLRPKKYSTDKSSSVSALQHAVKYMEKKNMITYDFVIELMATNPLKNVDDIDERLKEIAMNFGIKSNQFDKCLIDESVSDKILNGRIEAQKKYSINSTPTIVINEEKFNKNGNFKNIKKKIDKLI